MKQGNPTKRFGIIALIGAMLGGFDSKARWRNKYRSTKEKRDVANKWWCSSDTI